MGKAATVITATLVAVFFSGLANAGRVYVPQKSGSASTVASAIASRVGDVVSAGAMEGTYIPGYQQDRQVPVKVINSNDFSARRTFEAATNILKTRGPAAAAVVGTAAVMWAVDQVGGFIDDNQQPVKKAGDPSAVPGQFYDASGSYGKDGKTACSLAASKWFGGTTGDYRENWPNAGANSCVFGSGGYVSVDQRQCQAGTAMNFATQKCESGYEAPSGQPEPFTQSDWDKLQQAMNSASGSNTAGDPNFIKDLIHASCEGSLAPQRCYDSLLANGPGQASQSLSGPSSVSAPGTSSITVSKDKDGNATATTTTSNTTFNITYGNNYYSYSSTTTKTKTNPDGSTETTTEEEPDDSAEKYPEQPDPLSPVIKEYDKVTEAVKTPQETVAGLDSKAWFSFGGSCQELDLDTPIGHIKTNYCPTVESYVKPVLAFMFAVFSYLYCAAIWRETTMTVRPT